MKSSLSLSFSHTLSPFLTLASLSLSLSLFLPALLSPSHPGRTTHIRKRLAAPEAEPPAA